MWRKLAFKFRALSSRSGPAALTPRPGRIQEPGRQALPLAYVNIIHVLLRRPSNVQSREKGTQENTRDSLSTAAKTRQGARRGGATDCTGKLFYQFLSDARGIGSGRLRLARGCPLAFFHPSQFTWRRLWGISPGGTSSDSLS